MANIIFSTFKWFRNLSVTKMVIGIVVVAIVTFGGYSLFGPKKTNYQFVTVEKGSIAETVSVTGNTTPISSVNLGFGNSGTIAFVQASVGKTVTKGQVLASLDTSDLQAQLKQAQANLAIQIAGGQNTAANVDEVTKQQDTLVASAHRTLLSSGLVATPESSTYAITAPTISGSYSGSEGTYQFLIDSIQSGFYRVRTFGIENTGPIQISKTGPTPLGEKGLYLTFSDNLGAYLNTQWEVDIPNTTSSSYLANYNAYQQAQQTRTKAIADAQADIANSGGTTVSQAQIQNAQAAVDSAEAKLRNSNIVAPISGLVTQFDAKVGEFSSPGTNIVSIISGSSFEVDALVSETDVGKIVLGNKVSMTLDAFPGETFTGSVFYIDPAQTTNEGVVGYKIKISFDKADPRMKSGLTANLDIETRHKDGVLVLPQYAILQNDSGTFVQVLENNVTKDMPVTLGLQDQKGNVEIVSGVTEGERVLNIGLKP